LTEIGNEAYRKILLEHNKFLDETTVIPIVWLYPYAIDLPIHFCDKNPITETIRTIFKTKGITPIEATTATHPLGKHFLVMPCNQEQEITQFIDQFCNEYGKHIPEQYRNYNFTEKPRRPARHRTPP